MASKTFGSAISQASTCHSHHLTDVLQMCHAVTHLYVCLCGFLSLKYSSHSLENSYSSSKTRLRLHCPQSFQTPYESSTKTQHLRSITQYHCNICFPVQTTLTHCNLLTHLSFSSSFCLSNHNFLKAYSFSLVGVPVPRIIAGSHLGLSIY